MTKVIVGTAIFCFFLKSKQNGILVLSYIIKFNIYLNILKFLLSNELFTDLIMCHSIPKYLLSENETKPYY